MSDPNESTSTGDDGTALLSSACLELCAKLRHNDPSILPAVGQSLVIRNLSEREEMELADALLENTNVKYLDLQTENYTESSAEAMAKYVRTSKHLQRIDWNITYSEELLCCFLLAFQESTSLKELYIPIAYDLLGVPSNLALENMLTHTHSLRSLSLHCPEKGIAAAAVASGLQKNTTLRELIFRRNDEFARGDTETNVSTILNSLRDHPLLRRLSLGDLMDLTGLETLLRSDASKITDLDIHTSSRGPPMMGLTQVLKALAQRGTLTKLTLKRCPLGRDEARLLRMVLCKTPSLQSLVLTYGTLGSAALAEVAQALNHNTSIKVLDVSHNDKLADLESANIFGGILRNNKTITTFDLSGNDFGETPGAVDCIADGLASNSTLLNIDLSDCFLEDRGVYILAQTLDFRITALKKINLGTNYITHAGVGVIIETLEQSSHHITDLDLKNNRIGSEGARFLARSLENNALPNLKELSLSYCGLDDDKFIAMVSALKQNTSLLQLDLRNNGLSDRAFFALAESLPEIKVLQRVDFTWCTGLASAMPLLLAGLRMNTSLFRFHVDGCAPFSAPPTIQETAKCAGGWIREIESVGYRNRCLSRCLSLIRAQPRGVWSHALARVATFPDGIFEVLRSKPSLVPS
jgi:Ran GTPase-activating protein (RanGAP) involved in mRNA processing and transport